MPDDTLSAPVEQEDTGSATESLENPASSNQSGNSGDQQPQTEKAQGAATDVPEATKDGKPILDPAQLPSDASQKDKDYATQMMRYFSKRTEGIADQVKKAQEYESLTQSQDWQAYQQWKTSQTQVPQYNAPQQTVDPTALYLQREMDDAIANGDSQKMFEVNQKIVDYRLEKQLSEKEKVFKDQMSQMQMSQKQLHNNMILEEFGKLHPKLWEYHKAGIAVPILREYEAKGKSLEEAYQEMERVAGYFGKQTRQQDKKIIEEKKQAVAHTPSGGQEGEYVYVTSRAEADKLNFEYAQTGSSKVAVVKRK